MNSICVFCGASSGNRAAYAQAAEALGAELLRRGCTLVYGGGNIGLMGTIARAVDAGGGTIVSIIPRALTKYEGAESSPGELILVDTMLERKAIMGERSDGFVVMPGGFGTLDELFEMLTWSQLGIHSKPIGLLNVHGFFDPLLALVDHHIAEGFVREQYRDLLVADDNPATLLDKIAEQAIPQSMLVWDVSD